MVKLIGFQVLGVTDEDALEGACIDLGVVFVLDKHEGTTTNFTEVQEVQFQAVPCLVRCFANGA